MAYNQPNNIQLDPNTGEYYTEQMYYPQQQRDGFIGTGGGRGDRGTSFFAPVMENNEFLNSMGWNYNNYGMPRNIRKNTGDMSMVWEQMQNRQPYQYNAPSVAEMFSSMAMPNMNQQYTGGAGQFLNGLLGNVAMPTPVSTVAVK